MFCVGYGLTETLALVFHLSRWEVTYDCVLVILVSPRSCLDRSMLIYDSKFVVWTSNRHRDNRAEFLKQTQKKLQDVTDRKSVLVLFLRLKDDKHMICCIAGSFLSVCKKFWKKQVPWNLQNILFLMILITAWICMQLLNRYYRNLISWRKRTCGTFSQDEKYVPISTYDCSFQMKLTLEAVKQRVLVIIFVHSYDYIYIFFAFFGHIMLAPQLSWHRI